MEAAQYFSVLNPGIGFQGDNTTESNTSSTAGGYGVSIMFSGNSTGVSCASRTDGGCTSSSATQLAAVLPAACPTAATQSVARE